MQRLLPIDTAFDRVSPLVLAGLRRRGLRRAEDRASATYNGFMNGMPIGTISEKFETRAQAIAS